MLVFEFLSLECISSIGVLVLVAMKTQALIVDSVPE